MNRHVSSWVDVTTGVSQGSIPGPLLFLIYINDLANGLCSNAKLFADTTSLFSVIHEINTTANELSNDLTKINSWTYQCEMSSKQDPEVIFSHKSKKITHRPLIFNNIQVSQSSSQKHLRAINILQTLENGRTFKNHMVKP